MSRKPIPPFFFVVHSFFQFIQCIFLSFFVFPHQYLAIVELIESHRDFGSLKRLIVYVGMAYATVLINISLPALEINFSFHPMTRFVICSCISLKVVTLDFPHAIGRPSYFSQSVIILAPKIC